MKTSLFVITLLLGIAAGGGVGWVLWGADAPGAAGGTQRREGEEAQTPIRTESPGATVTAEDDETVELRGAPGASQRLEDLESENRELEAQVEALQARVEELAPAAPKDPEAFRFGLATSTPSFDGADWPNLAAHMRALADGMPDLRDEILAGQQPSAATIQKLQRHNTPLAAFAIAVSAEMEGTEPNDAYTHPAVIANLIRAALLRAENALTRDQEIAIRALGDAWGAEEERRASARSPDAPALARKVAEVDAKLRFLASVKTVLTASQREILFDPQTEGRIGIDLLSPALAYQMRNPVTATDRETLETNLLGALLGLGGIELEEPSDYAWIASRWLDEAPAGLQPVGGRSVEMIFPHVDQIQAQARAQVAAMERIIGMGALSEAQAAALRESTMVLMPQLVATP
ncbi:MAG: hypothetical protein ACYTG6_10640 [Planctomycetota bacterium]|jgi:hypothetical protein